MRRLLYWSLIDRCCGFRWTLGVGHHRTQPREADWSCLAGICATNNQNPQVGATLTGDAAFSNSVFTPEGKAVWSISASG